MSEIKYAITDNNIAACWGGYVAFAAYAERNYFCSTNKRLTKALGAIDTS